MNPGNRDGYAIYSAKIPLPRVQTSTADDEVAAGTLRATKVDSKELFDIAALKFTRERLVGLATAFTITWCGPVIAQPVPFPGLEVVEVPLVAWVTARDRALPNTLSDFVESEERLAMFRTFSESLATQNWGRVRELTTALSYEAVAIKEADRWFVVAYDNSKRGRDPTLIINTSSARRNIILEAPHASFEPGTAEQAVTLLRDLGGLAAIISGAHRCASRSFTRCDGRTSVCGALEDYRDSDVGHNTGTLFNAAHIVFSKRWENSIVVSLHGMKEDATGVGTKMIISNGAHDKDSSGMTAATRLRLALGPRFNPAGTIVNCNYPADDVFNYRKLCGYTNVQGREVNGGVDACRASVETGTGRFIHIEQDWHVLQPYSQKWARLYEFDWPKVILESFSNVVPASLP
jgi:hypothetical protein